MKSSDKIFKNKLNTETKVKQIEHNNNNNNNNENKENNNNNTTNGGNNDDNNSNNNNNPKTLNRNPIPEIKTEITDFGGEAITINPFASDLIPTDTLKDETKESQNDINATANNNNNNNNNEKTEINDNNNNR